MRKLFFCFLACYGLFVTDAFSATHRTSYSQDALNYFPTSLQNVIARIHRLPEARQLIAQVQQNGPVQVVVNKAMTKEFGAFWEGTSRTILITEPQQRSESELIHSLLFELHNALTDHTLEQLSHLAQTRKIDKDTFVERVERMEHSNALRTKALIDKGIQMGIFPTSAAVSVIRDFQDHYTTQQIFGHSGWIATQYELYNPAGKQMTFHGTVPQLHQLTEQDKRDLVYYICLKDDLASSIPEVVQRAKRALHSELNRFKGGYVSSQRHWFRFVFKDMG